MRFASETIVSPTFCIISRLGFIALIRASSCFVPVILKVTQNLLDIRLILQKALGIKRSSGVDRALG